MTVTCRNMLWCEYLFVSVFVEMGARFRTMMIMASGQDDRELNEPAVRER
jgi:hypothetical protein